MLGATFCIYSVLLGEKDYFFWRVAGFVGSLHNQKGCYEKGPHHAGLSLV